MADFLALPSELIYEIFDYLQPFHHLDHKYREWDHHASSNTLAALARTCHHLRPIATRVLYRRYYAPLDQPIGAFIRNLKAQPKISEHIKHIHVHADDQPWHSFTARPSVEIQADVLEDMVLDQTGYFGSATCCTPGDELALLLSKASNLETLRVLSGYTCFGISESVFEQLWFKLVAGSSRTVAAAPAGKVMFERLHTLEISLAREFSSDLAYLFLLPCLRHLRLESIDCDPYMDDNSLQWPIPPSSSTVQILELVFNHAPAALATHMISSCKSLSVFDCIRIKAWYITIAPWLAEIVASLEKHVTSLTKLSIDTHRCDRGNMYQRLEGINQFHKLKSLSIPFELLVGTTEALVVDVDKHELQNILPQDIEDLWLIISTNATTGATYTAAILNLLKPYSGSNSPFKKVHITYASAFQHFEEHSLPFDFWNVERVLRPYNFEYDYSIDVEDWIDGDESSNPYDSDNSEVDHHVLIARVLAALGPQGCQIAGHIEPDRYIYTIRTKICRILGLEEEWWLTDEAREIMLID